MKLTSHSTKNKAHRKAAAALAVFVATVSAGQSAFAQGANTAGNYSPNGTLGADQESLLPPEVVPLDPSAANSMSSAQATNRQTQVTDANSIPGLVPTAQGKGTISAKDFRQSAFDNLYSQGQAPGQNPSQMPQGWQQAGEVNYNQGQQNSLQNMYSPQAQQMANNQAPQAQTLTGPPKTKPKRHDTRRGGFTNTMNGLATFGAGALSATYMMNRPGNALMGLGMWGLTTTGFGTRNGFRF
jgi:hypothetical protein